MDSFRYSTYNLFLVGVAVLATACGQTGGRGSDSQRLSTVSDSIVMTDERLSSIAVSDLLQSSEPSKAARGVEQLSCASIDSSVLAEVRRVWRMRESSTGDSA